MKQFLFVLLFSIAAHSQSSHYKVENKQIVWEARFKTNETDIVDRIDKNHPMLRVDRSNNTGKCVQMYSNCKFNFYDEALMPFSFDFKITIVGNQFTITASHFIFDIDNENNNKIKKYNLEKLFLVKRKTKITSNENKIKYLECLNLYFIKLFKIPNTEVIE